MASKAAAKTATKSASKQPPKGVVNKLAQAAKGKAGKDAAEEKDEGAAAENALPLLDLNDAGVKKMIKAAKKRGSITIDQINEVMPSG